jgi:hypothetical protein
MRQYDLVSKAPKIMSDLIVALVDQEVSNLLDSWMESEKNKVDFPVPFDIAWQIAGYSIKANAKRALSELREGIEFSSYLMKTPKVGRPSEVIMLSIKGFVYLQEQAKEKQLDSTLLMLKKNGS